MIAIALGERKNSSCFNSIYDSKVYKYYHQNPAFLMSILSNMGVNYHNRTAVDEP